MYIKLKIEYYINIYIYKYKKNTNILTAIYSEKDLISQLHIAV